MFTWILSLAGSACIFIELGEWVSGPSQTHALLGVVTTILAFFQPIFAAFRPHPDSSKRPIFNWIHWLVGNAAHIFSSEYIIMKLFKNRNFRAKNFNHKSFYNTWFHFVFTVLTIFFAVSLSKAELPAWMDWILVAYVGFYVIIHLILSVCTIRITVDNKLIKINKLQLCSAFQNMRYQIVWFHSLSVIYYIVLTGRMYYCTQAKSILPLLRNNMYSTYPI